MAEFNEKLQELKGKIDHEFDTYKSFNNEFGQTDHKSYKDLDYLLFKINKQIDQMRTGLSQQKSDEYPTQTKDVDFQKAITLIKLHSLLSIITCNVMKLNKAS